MSMSIWRYSHFTLAVSSFLFIIIASITGIILAFEPISNQLKPYAISDVSDISVSEMVVVLQQEFEEVISVERNHENFVIASVITKAGASQTIYIHPKTGKKIREVVEKAAIFKFATSLHRSLFLKSTGRFIVGFVSLLLFLITISGLLLILKRQGGFKRFFFNISKENLYQFSHIAFGRIFLIPLLIITVTGVYLSLEKFNLLPKNETKHVIDFDGLNSAHKKTIAEFEIFNNTKLSEFKKIEFPFSSDVEDYFLLELKNKEITVNQITGEVLSEVYYPFSKLISYYSLLLHTGQGSIFWSIILLLASIVTLYFIYSGFAMTFERIKGKTKNRYNKDESEIVLLVGSENGSTRSYGKMLYKALLNEGKRVFITDLNKYTSYKKMKYVIVLTATYGEGESPSNGSNFLELIKQKNNHPFQFSVVAFGSLSYPKFCQFGIDVQSALEQRENATELLPLYKINNKSFEPFSKWTQELNHKLSVNLQLDKRIVSKQQKSFTLELSSKMIVNNDDTFLLTFDDCHKNFTSGDLLGVYANNQTHERLYSIAKINNTLLLSIRKHELGLCSNYLYNLQRGESIKAFIKRNPSFHFPKKASKVIMIATGTGIAPFLGMISEQRTTSIDLYFGLRTKKSLELYKDILRENLLDNLYTVYSREANEKRYVQDVIQTQIDTIISDLENGAVIMICGAIAMQNEVFSILEEALSKRNQALSFYEKRKQILVDCY
ncbi:MAG: PepSY domain-containing protein [Tenacibaculum sp.]|nr:PepSY domain-containing protein [Tenacibaculum sp.]